jgi:hypothetical protein
MSFLQPWLLAGLPLVALPIIIHLINQRRFQTIDWAAMMFLLAAHRMARGYSKLRQWLILLFRVLAVAGLIFGISRPLASGWLGVTAGGHADTTLILLDRSPSMQQRDRSTGRSKLESGLHQLSATLETLGSSRWVLIDSATRKPQEMLSPASLLELPSAGPTSASADLPSMLQAAYDYVRDNRPGQTDIWICSDLRDSDWIADSGRWSTLRNAFLETPQGVRIQLLAYPEIAATNVSIRVTNVRRQATSDGAELQISLRLMRDGASEEKLTLPVQFEIEGARSVAEVEFVGAYADLKDHPIPLERGRERGWGKVSIPADANMADNEFYFAFDNPPPLRTIIVADNPLSERPLQLSAGIAMEPTLVCTTEIVSPDQLSTVEWEQISLLLWQAPLPMGDAAKLVDAFVDRGGQVVFFPPDTPTADAWRGLHWESWKTVDTALTVENWRSDEDLLARTLSGTALPVGQIEINRHCGLAGEFTALATLRGGAPLLARAPAKRGGIYFWTTTPSPQDSTLATNGVVLYAFVQRALASGASVLGNARQLDAGVSDGERSANWNRIAPQDRGISTEYLFHGGVYQAEDRLLAVNRPRGEDSAKVLENAQTDELFSGLPFVRVDEQAGSLSSLVQEIWRLFLLTMMTALVLEAVLCLPKLARPAGANV